MTHVTDFGIFCTGEVNKTMWLLGLTGKKRHGKDTFARALCSTDRAWRRVAFADFLKDVCVEVFGLDSRLVTDEVAKEQPLDRPIVIDDYLPKLSAATKLSLQPHGLVANTPRQLLQFVGTDYVRAVQPNYWVDHVFENIKRAHELDMWEFYDKPHMWRRFVITDMRFPNESSRVDEFRGAYRLRIHRLGVETATTPEHVSEALDFPVTSTLAIVDGDYSLPNAILAFYAMTGDRQRLDVFLRAFDWAAVREGRFVNASAQTLAERYYRDYLGSGRQTAVADVAGVSA